MNVRGSLYYHCFFVLLSVYCICCYYFCIYLYQCYYNCTIFGRTLYMQREDQIKKKKKKKKKIASHSITHRLPIAYWESAPYEDYDREIDGQRSLLTSLSGVKKEYICGYRSPFIQPGGNTQFQVLMDRNFTYDSSLLVWNPSNEDRVWPYTLDVPYQTTCHLSPCPSDKFPGLWELPIQPIPDQTGTPCVFLDRCMETMSRDEIYGYLFASFNSSYHRNKAPLIINMHTNWYNENPNGTIAFDDFIQDLVNMNDVYVITANQVVEWMKEPTKLADLENFDPFKFINRTTEDCGSIPMSCNGQRQLVAKMTLVIFLTIFLSIQIN